MDGPALWPSASVLGDGRALILARSHLLLVRPDGVAPHVQSCGARVLIVRLRWRQLGGHIHCRVFTASTFDGFGGGAKNGELTFDLAQWQALAPTFEMLSVEQHGVVVQVKHEDEL